jgi:hypothetical protein
MSWQIGVKENTLKITKECFAELEKWGENEGHSLYHKQNGTIAFDSDAMEHMDFISDDDVRCIIVKHGGLGDVVFMSAEGDNRGAIWGYRFKKGKCVSLNAVVTYEEVE